MKKTILYSLSLLLLLGAASTRAADAAKLTFNGEGKCAKCSLKETKTCQNAVVVEEAGKKITYLLEENELSKKFHPNLCTEVKKVKVVGTVKEVDGKKVITAASIDLAAAAK